VRKRLARIEKSVARVRLRSISRVKAPVRSLKAARNYLILPPYQQNNLFRGVPATPPYGPEIALFWGRYLIPVRTKRKAKK